LEDSLLSLIGGQLLEFAQQPHRLVVRLRLGLLDQRIHLAPGGVGPFRQRFQLRDALGFRSRGALPAPALAQRLRRCPELLDRAARPRLAPLCRGEGAQPPLQRCGKVGFSQRQPQQKLTALFLRGLGDRPAQVVAGCRFSFAASLGRRLDQVGVYAE
jgi:hypothetical protein